MTIDKSKLTIADKGDQIVSITLKDEFYPDSLKQTITNFIVKIEYQSKPEEVIIEEEVLPETNSTDEARNSTNSTDSESIDEEKTDDLSKTTDTIAIQTKTDEQKVSNDAEQIGEDSKSDEVISEKAKQEEVVPEKPKETASESALVQEKGEPKIETQGPAVAEWSTQVDPEVMKAQIAKSIAMANLRA